MLLACPARSREVHAYHQAAMPQRENACGAFALACLLRGLGFESWRGYQVDQDLVAYLAGMIALEEEYPLDGDPGTALQGRWGFARAYRYPLLRTGDLAAAGTGPEGLTQALEAISEGELAAVPVRGRRRDGWPLGGGELLALLEALLAPAARSWKAQVLFNYQTGPLAALEGSGDGLGDLLLGVPPSPCEWDVGHVTSLAGILAAGDGGPALLLRDSSPHFGWRGYHPERPAAVARALARTDGSQGGMLVLCPAADRESVAAALLTACPEAEIFLWDNGSRYRPPAPLPDLSKAGPASLRTPAAPAATSPALDSFEGSA